MALQFNTYAKVNSMLAAMNLYGTGANMSLKIYPSTVALPSLPPAYNGAPAGFLINFISFTTAKVSNQFKLTVTPASTAAVATGVPNWFFFVNGNTSTAGVMIGDSIGLSGSSPVVTLNSMSLVSGTSYSLIDMTLTMI
jgi:hypothetical protein